MVFKILILQDPAEEEADTLYRVYVEKTQDTKRRLSKLTIPPYEYNV